MKKASLQERSSDRDDLRPGRDTREGRWTIGPERDTRQGRLRSRDLGTGQGGAPVIKT